MPQCAGGPETRILDSPLLGASQIFYERCSAASWEVARCVPSTRQHETGTVQRHELVSGGDIETRVEGLVRSLWPPPRGYCPLQPRSPGSLWDRGNRHDAVALGDLT